MEFIWSIHMITNDKIGQIPVKFDNVIDNIFNFFVVWMFTKEKYFFLQHTT